MTHQNPSTVAMMIMIHRISHSVKHSHQSTKTHSTDGSPNLAAHTTRVIGSYNPSYGKCLGNPKKPYVAAAKQNDNPRYIGFYDFVVHSTG